MLFDYTGRNKKGCGAMRLVSATGDFTWYVDSVEQEIREFHDSKFRYVNLEQVDPDEKAGHGSAVRYG